MRNRIREFRKAKGMTQAQLAELAKISTEYLSRLENAKRRLNTDVLGNIASALGRSVSDLFMDDPEGALGSVQSVMVIGEARTQRWVPHMSWSRDQQYEVVVPRAPEAANLYGLEVGGPAMNREFKEGTVAICADLADFSRALKSGDFVVIETRRADGMREYDVRQLQVDATDKAWLWPRSTDPNYQAPIPIAWPLAEAPDDRPEGVAIKAIVVGAYQNLA